ncbi:hypothetical protein ACFJGX_03540 [Hydrogenophaga sp. UC242_50]|uniref:hypothetical protein n=1 Tax=Hydrogenophaga sp. UC242_50 TaxID=3350169 RepID=UPI0036D3ED09
MRHELPFAGRIAGLADGHERRQRVGLQGRGPSVPLQDGQKAARVPRRDAVAVLKDLLVLDVGEIVVVAQAYFDVAPLAAGDPAGDGGARLRLLFRLVAAGLQQVPGVLRRVHHLVGVHTQAAQEGLEALIVPVPVDEPRGQGRLAKVPHAGARREVPGPARLDRLGRAGDVRRRVAEGLPPVQGHQLVPGGNVRTRMEAPQRLGLRRGAGLRAQLHDEPGERLAVAMDGRVDHRGREAEGDQHLPGAVLCGWRQKPIDQAARDGLDRATLVRVGQARHRAGLAVVVGRHRAAGLVVALLLSGPDLGANAVPQHVAAREEDAHQAGDAHGGGAEQGAAAQRGQRCGCHGAPQAGAAVDAADPAVQVQQVGVQPFQLPPLVAVLHQLQQLGAIRAVGFEDVLVEPLGQQQRLALPAGIHALADGLQDVEDARHHVHGAGEVGQGDGDVLGRAGQRPAGRQAADHGRRDGLEQGERAETDVAHPGQQAAGDEMARLQALLERRRVGVRQRPQSGLSFLEQ